MATESLRELSGVSPVFLRVLGPVRVTRSLDTTLPVLTEPRPIAVLTWLALAAPRGMHSRDTLLALFWPESDERAARHALRNVLHTIRRALGDRVLVAAGDGLIGVDQTLLRSDLFAIESSIAALRFDDVMRGYTGEFMAGFLVSDAPGFNDWLDAERLRVRSMVSDAMWAHVRQLRSIGAIPEAMRVARGAFGLDKDSEPALRRLLVFLDQCGDRAGALRVYEEFAERLHREYETEPAPETVEVVRRLRTRRHPSVTATRIDALAVLPVADLTANASPHLCEALTSGVISRLAQRARCSIRARGVVARYNAPGVDPLAAGRELDVDAVVQAMLSAGRDGDLSVTLEMIRVSDGSRLYGDTFAAPETRLYWLEGEIAHAVCRAVSGCAMDEWEDASTPPPTADGAAYILYARGHYLFLRATPGGHTDELRRSREFFDAALARDPNFAMAIAGLSNYYAISAVRGSGSQFHETFGVTLELSRRALELDPRLAIPHVHFGAKAMYLDCDWELAVSEFDQAVALDPLYPESRRFQGVLADARGSRERARAEFQAAVDLEPQIPIYRNSLGAHLLSHGDYDGAVAQLRAALELDAGYGAARQRLIRCFERMQDYEAAVEVRAGDPPSGNAEEFRRALDRAGSAGYREARAREIQQVIPALEARARENPKRDAADMYNPPQLRLALCYAELGDWKRAFEWEEHACSENPGRRLWFTSAPELAPLSALRPKL